MDSCLDYSMFTLRSELLQPNQKKRKTEHSCPMIFGVMRTSLGKPKTAEVRILCDSGASKSIIKSDLVKKLRVKRDSHTRWKTAAGNFDTNATAKVQFKMPEFHETTAVEWTFHVTKQPLGYDIILGRDLLEELGVTIDFKTLTLTWDDVSVPMKDVNSFPHQGGFYSSFVRK